MRVALALGLMSLALLLPASAAAGDGFPWRERASSYGHLSVTFVVDRIVVGPRGWSAVLEMHNWDIDLALHDDFALLVDGRRVLPATRARPPLPVRLGVRAAWRGTISGTRRPPHGSTVRLRLGTFRAEIAPNLILRHVTRHVYRVP
ncbi:MAG: hypothetical protein ACM3QU_09075 [Verrucomicrobiota bacterium]